MLMDEHEGTWVNLSGNLMWPAITPTRLKKSHLMIFITDCCWNKHKLTSWPIRSLLQNIHYQSKSILKYINSGLKSYKEGCDAFVSDSNHPEFRRKNKQNATTSFYCVAFDIFKCKITRCSDKKPKNIWNKLHKQQANSLRVAHKGISFRFPQRVSHSISGKYQIIWTNCSFQGRKVKCLCQLAQLNTCDKNAAGSKNLLSAW